MKTLRHDTTNRTEIDQDRPFGRLTLVRTFDPTASQAEENTETSAWDLSECFGRGSAWVRCATV